MKKVRIIVAALCGALMVMGVGYAAWSQTLVATVIGSTTKMDVLFIAASTVQDQYTTGSAAIVGIPASRTNALHEPVQNSIVINNLGTSIFVRMGQLYPNDIVTVHTKIKNFSKMPVHMTRFSLCNITASVPALLNDVQVGFDLTGEWKKLSANAIIPYSVALAPGDTMDFTFYVKLDAASGNGTQSQYCSFSIIPSYSSN